MGIDSENMDLISVAGSGSVLRQQRKCCGKQRP